MFLEAQTVGALIVAGLRLAIPAYGRHRQQPNRNVTDPPFRDCRHIQPGGDIIGSRQLADVISVRGRVPLFPNFCEGDQRIRSYDPLRDTSQQKRRSGVSE
jgi:hypothetical protein